MINRDMPSRLASRPSWATNVRRLRKAASALAGLVGRRRGSPPAVVSLAVAAGLRCERGISTPELAAVSACDRAEPQILQARLPERTIIELSPGRFLAHAGVAFAPGGEAIAETFSSPYRLGRALAWGELGHDHVLRIDGSATTIECGTAWSNHYHVLIDALPKLWLLHAADRPSRPLTVMMGASASERYWPLAIALAPDGVQIRRFSGRPLVEADTYVHLPQLSADYCGLLPADYLAHFRQRAGKALGLAASADHATRIIVSRRRAPKRRVLNEDEIALCLGPLGFRRIDLEDLTLSEQAQLFRDAEIVVAPHGAGLTNIVFSERCRVLELFPGASWTHYRWLAHACGLAYASLSSGAGGKHDDFSIPAGLVARQLEDLGWI